MDNFFLIKECSNVILYGAAAIGLIVKEKFEKRGCRVCGFIDQRADEIDSYLSLPVWKIDALPKTLKKNETLVFVAVKNVFEHDTIVGLLLEQGFHNIIYKPYGTIYNGATTIEKKIGRIYDIFMDEKVQMCLDEKIPITVKESDRALVDFSLLHEDETTVTAYIPVEFVYTNNYTDAAMKKWGNINILAFFTHLQYFRYLSGDRTASYWYYLNEYCVYTANIKRAIEITEEWKKNVLRNRAIIYEQMNLSLEIDPGFFARNAAEAEWNDKGYFNLTSGKHRSSFLVSRGYRHIPLKVSQRDYLKFANQSVAEQVYQFLEETVDKSIEAPISNPFFYRKPYLGRELYYGLIERYTCRIAQEMYINKGKICFEELKMLELLADNNMVARHYAKMGCDVTCLSNDSMDKALDELLYTDGLLKYCKGIYSDSYDIVFWNAMRYPQMIGVLKRMQIKMLVILCNSQHRKEYEDMFGMLELAFSSMTDKGLVNVYEQPRN